MFIQSKTRMKIVIAIKLTISLKLSKYGMKFDDMDENDHRPHMWGWGGETNGPSYLPLQTTLLSYYIYFLLYELTFKSGYFHFSPFSFCISCFISKKHNKNSIQY
jgi:hypothetical protein